MLEAFPFPPAIPARALCGGLAVRMDGAQWRFLQREFHLTGAECRLALLLGQGLSPAEIGVQLGVERSTVRTQAKAVYRKLGVHR